jgi:DNA-binding transcriptional MerR regulator
MEAEAKAVDKSPDAFRTISEAAAGMDLPQHVLRFWETRFPQIKPLKRGGGRRYYRPDDIELLCAIKRLLYDEGYTIKGVQKMLKEHGAQALTRPAASPAPGRASPAARRVEPVMAAPAPEPPPAAVPAARASSGLADAATLRALLLELREAERILAQAATG